MPIALYLQAICSVAFFSRELVIKAGEDVATQIGGRKVAGLYVMVFLSNARLLIDRPAVDYAVIKRDF